jgi:hypothetical protein
MSHLSVADIQHDDPPKKKLKASPSLNIAAQTTHNVEQDGYGKHVSHIIILHQFLANHCLW